MAKARASTRPPSASVTPLSPSVTPPAASVTPDSPSVTPSAKPPCTRRRCALVLAATLGMGCDAAADIVGRLTDGDRAAILDIIDGTDGDKPTRIRVILATVTESTATATRSNPDCETC